MPTLSRCLVPALAAALVLVAPVSLAYAQGIPAEGNFAITYTAVNAAPAKPVSLGDRDISVASSVMTAVNDSGSGLLHNMAGRCNGMTEINKATRMFETHGYCNYSDRSGDQVFEEYSTPSPQPLGASFPMRGKWLGGTGKFVGLSGDIEIHHNVVLASETLAQAAGKKIGTYSIKQPVAEK